MGHTKYFCRIGGHTRTAAVASRKPSKKKATKCSWTSIGKLNRFYEFMYYNFVSYVCLAIIDADLDVNTEKTTMYSPLFNLVICSYLAI